MDESFFNKNSVELKLFSTNNYIPEVIYVLFFNYK